MTSVGNRAKKRRLMHNELGRRIGESHPRAVLTDHEVDLMFELRDEGYSIRWLARKFEVSTGCVWKIVTGRRRGQTGVVRVRDVDEGR